MANGTITSIKTSLLEIEGPEEVVNAIIFLIQNYEEGAQFGERSEFTSISPEERQEHSYASYLRAASALTGVSNEDQALIDENAKAGFPLF